MKYLKALLIILLTIFTLGSAMAQVEVQARVGGPYHRHWHHRHWHSRRWHRRYQHDRDDHR
jgi:hypothetical protein